MQDIEFTIEEGRLYMLQTRNGKRPALAAVRFAVDAVAEGLLDQGTRRSRTIDAPRSTRCCTRPSIRSAHYKVLARGVAAVPGRRQGHVVFNAPTRPSRPARRATRSMLVRTFTEPEDVAGILRGAGHPHERGRQG